MMQWVSFRSQNRFLLQHFTAGTRSLWGGLEELAVCQAPVSCARWVGLLETGMIGTLKFRAAYQKQLRKKKI